MGWARRSRRDAGPCAPSRRGLDRRRRAADRKGVPDRPSPVFCVRRSIRSEGSAPAARRAGLRGGAQRRHRMPSRPRDARKPGGAIKPKGMADTQ